MQLSQSIFRTNSERKILCPNFPDLQNIVQNLFFFSKNAFPFDISLEKFQNSKNVVEKALGKCFFRKTPGASTCVDIMGSA